MNVQGLTRKQIAGIAMALVVVGSVMAVAPSVLAQTGDGTDDDGSNATTRSTFDSDDDGWTLKGDAEAIEPIYKASGGNPGGYLFAEDTATGGVYYWNASTKFLGDRSASYGGTLSFDLRQSETSAQFADDDIQLVSGDTTLTYDFGDSSTHPGTDWTPYSVDLRASAGWVNDDTGENATDSEMQAVLGDLTYLRIRGEYHNGADTGSLDNVVMSGPPSDKRTTTTTETTTKEPTEEPTPTETTPSTPTATATPTATVTATPTSTTKPTSERSTTEIDSCTVIDDPGRYVLTQDITDSTESTCIEITADDVVLDSDGHTVDGTDATDSVGVSVVGSASGPTSPDTNVTVAGLVVTDWAVGIQYDGVKNGTISDSSVASNEGEGFGASGISLELTTNVTVTNTSVDANDGNGITLGIDARGNTVSDNTVSANGIGISVEQSSNNRIEANVITENAAGIDIELGGGNLVTDNVVTDNHNGIGLTDTSQNVLSENNISSNNGSGIFVALIGGNTVTDNTVNSNLGTGIVVLSAGGDTISNNTATNNAVWDYAASESTTESVVDLDIGSAIVSFDATDIGLGGVEMPPADPTDYTNIGQYVNTTDIDDTDNDSSLTLNVGYSDADVASANVNESTLRLFVFADGEWSPVESTVDTTTNTVSANVTDFDNGTVFAPLGRTADEDETPNETVYYQVDFVSGKPIENLRDEEGTYSNDELIRFAHGSTDQPMMRLSEGEFTTDDDLAERIESQDIAVEDGTATTTFTVSEGESVTLSLVSYTKPGPGWSPETEPQQEFVDAETRTFESGTHTLTVDLPEAETNATD